MNHLQSVIVGERYADSLREGFEKEGYSVIGFPDNPYVDQRLSGHIDLSLFSAPGMVVFSTRNYLNIERKSLLKSFGLSVVEIPEVQTMRYPGDCLLNCCFTGEYFLYSAGITSSLIVEYMAEHIGSKKMISVKQGYVRCSVCIVTPDSIITSDPGIADICERKGLDIYKTTPGNIELPGYSYGFIGGASFILDAGHLAFTGRMKGNMNQNICRFIKDRGVEPLFLSSKDAFDCGSGLIIPPYSF